MAYDEILAAAIDEITPKTSVCYDCGATEELEAFVHRSGTLLCPGCTEKAHQVVAEQLEREYYRYGWSRE